MKRIIIILFALLPMLLTAGVTINNQNSENENDVVISVTDTRILDVAENSGGDPDTKEYNVCAYGVYAMMYVRNSKYDGVTVEYRVIYKSQQEESEWKYLGTTPFAYCTEKMYDNNFTAKGDPKFQELKEFNPLVIENAKDVKKIEFRLSGSVFKTTIVKPIKDVYVGGGPVMFIPLNKLKPQK